jgi:hypothetical protein
VLKPIDLEDLKGLVMRSWGAGAATLRIERRLTAAARVIGESPTVQESAAAGGASGTGWRGPRPPAVLITGETDGEVIARTSSPIGAPRRALSR